MEAMHIREVSLSQAELDLYLGDFIRLAFKCFDGREYFSYFAQDLFHFTGSGFGLIELNFIELSLELLS